MSTMIAELYDALKEAGASEEKARAAAKTMADYDSRFNKVDQDLALIKAEIVVLKWALFISRANTYYSCWCLALTPFRINALPHALGYRLVGWPGL